MNQILSTMNGNEEKKYNKIKSHTNGSDTKKIMIFGIIMLVFGLIIAGVGIYKYYLNNKEEAYVEPNITIEETDEGVKIAVTTELGIQQVAYYWNQEEKTVFNVNGSTTYEKLIDIMNGENTLTVTVLDGAGKENVYTKSFKYNVDEVLPTIEYNIVENESGEKSIEIIATDETQIDYLTYKWNDEEATTVPAEDGSTQINTQIEIKRGNNKLIITAVDKYGNEATTGEIPITGVKQPEVNVTKNGDTITMTVTHDMGFKKVEYILNGQTYTYDENFSGYDSTQTTLEFTFKLQEGENTVIINAYSMEDTEYNYVGQCTYEP